MKDTTGDPDPLAAECAFDYARARPNRFAAAGSLRYVPLDPDVSAAFGSAEAINALLRAVLQARPAVEEAPASS